MDHIDSKCQQKLLNPPPHPAPVFTSYKRLDTSRARCARSGPCVASLAKGTGLPERTQTGRQRQTRIIKISSADPAPVARITTTTPRSAAGSGDGAHRAEWHARAKGVDRRAPARDNGTEPVQLLNVREDHGDMARPGSIWTLADPRRGLSYSYRIWAPGKRGTGSEFASVYREEQSTLWRAVTRVCGPGRCCWPFRWSAPHCLLTVSPTHGGDPPCACNLCVCLHVRELNIHLHSVDVRNETKLSNGASVICKLISTD